MRTLSKLGGVTFVIWSATAMAADTTTYTGTSWSSTSVSSTYSTSSATGVVTTGMVAKDADNTELNRRDKSDGALTPQKQSNSESDIKTLAAVRSAIVDDDSLSTLAHNVKIIVANGVVTLRGPVKNANEKVRVEELARKVAGASRIDNQLDIDAH